MKNKVLLPQWRTSTTVETIEEDLTNTDSPQSLISHQEVAGPLAGEVTDGVRLALTNPWKFYSYWVQPCASL